MSRINIGCGSSPTPGWYNYDNSWSIFLAKIPFLATFIEKIGLLSTENKQFIAFAKTSDIAWADATRRIPLPDDSAEVFYSSHMLEHLDKEEAKYVLEEARRVLKPGGIVRIAVPDLAYLVNAYLKDKDADAFVESMQLIVAKPKSFVRRLVCLVTGDRNHKWMYDGRSLCNFLARVGFLNPQLMEPGTTIIPSPGDLNLYERSPGSVYVEAINP